MSAPPEDGFDWQKCLFRAILFISIHEDKAKRLYREGNIDGLRKSAVEMATTVRGLRGVRHTEAIVMTRWWPDPARGAEHRPLPPSAAPWQPCGALVMVEAEDKGTLDRYVHGVLAAARSVDQNAMEFMGTDIW
jgi:hypothetical protein